MQRRVKHIFILILILWILFAVAFVLNSYGYRTYGRLVLLGGFVPIFFFGYYLAFSHVVKTNMPLLKKLLGARPRNTEQDKKE